jgi:hypothetical protein
MHNIVLQTAQGQGGNVLLILIVCLLIWLAFYYYNKKLNNHLNNLSSPKNVDMGNLESSNSWDCISSWFKDIKDRKVIIREFNNAAQASYVNGKVPFQLKSSFSKGNRAYKHSTSAWLNSGFRIIVMTDQLVSEIELNKIGLSVLADSKVVRFLITLGWDTLEVVNNKGEIGIQWELTKWAAVTPSTQ